MRTINTILSKVTETENTIVNTAAAAAIVLIVFTLSALIVGMITNPESIQTASFGIM